jgi:hypothetical protein
LTLAELRGVLGYALALPRFLRRPLTAEEARSVIADGVRLREQRFLLVLERAVYGRGQSPYARLLRAAGIELGDLRSLVSADGIEGALGRLYDAGVFVTLEELRGRKPIDRLGVRTTARAGTFDNPLLGTRVTGRGLGSRGRPRRTIMSLEDLGHSAASTRLFFDAFGLGGRPVAFWRPVPPARAGLGHGLQLLKIGERVDRWFSQTRLARRPDPNFALTWYTLLAVRAAGKRLPAPEHVPLDQAERVAAWLAARTAEGRPAKLNAPASSALRVCKAASDRGLDVSGTFFRVGGEPFTAAKARVIAEAGGRAACHYTTSEIGRVGVACGAPGELDDVHLLTDKLAVIQRERRVGADGSKVAALHVSTVSPAARRIMLNVEIDDYAVLEERHCGCPFDEVGLSVHLHTIRSYDKLMSEGMSFLGGELLRLVEEVLPARFGGGPGDYQLVEEEVEGLPKVGVVISPDVGRLDDEVVVETVLEELSGPAYRTLMAQVWRDGRTVRVVRRRPAATGSGKILPLHLGRDESVSARTATVRVPRKGGGPDVTDSSTGSGGTSG